MALLRFLWRLIKVAFVLALLVVLTPITGLSYGFLTTDAVSIQSRDTDSGPSTELREQALALPGYQRAEEATFLTYPEWSIVYAARDYADFVAKNRESGFAYWSMIGRYWQDYALVIRATETYPFNVENHVMLVVIGTSHTIEHAIQWAWENTIGRLTESVSPVPVAEDAYQAAVAAEYAAFLDQTPWYRFAYAEKRAGLWAIETASGNPAVRSWERKLAFGLSYTIKQAYADLIASGLSATFDPAAQTLHVWATGPVALAIQGEPDNRVALDFGVDGAVFVTRRYQHFTELVPRLINRGLRFVEIAGNDHIFVTVLSSGPVTAPPGSLSLFSYALPANPGVWRTGIFIPVSQLHIQLPALEKSGAGLEHIYDY